MVSQIIENTKSIFSHIESSRAKVGRKDPIILVAVSKKQSVDKINEYIEFVSTKGISPVIGENYIQEFREKSPDIQGTFEAHFIGRLQSNKIKEIVSLFDVIESVHSADALNRINSVATQFGKVQKVFLQVNVSDDPKKSGFKIGDVEKAAVLARSLPGLQLQGLMTITELYDKAEDARQDFRKLREVRDSIWKDPQEGYLSMGMSQDFEVAIEEGATHVRIGTSIFGARE